MEHEADAGPCFFSLDGCFCSFSLSPDNSNITLHPEKLELFPKEAHVDLRMYETKNTSLEVPEETLLAVKPEAAVSAANGNRPSRFPVHTMASLSLPLLFYGSTHLRTIDTLFLFQKYVPWEPCSWKCKCHVLFCMPIRFSQFLHVIGCFPCTGILLALLHFLL